MAGTVVRGSVLLTPKFDNLGANVKRALGSGYKSAVSVHTNAGRQAAQNYASGFGGATGAIMGIVSSVTSRALDAISGSIASAVNRVDTIANFPKIMQSVGYSADEARATIERLSTVLTVFQRHLMPLLAQCRRLRLCLVHLPQQQMLLWHLITHFWRAASAKR